MRRAGISRRWAVALALAMLGGIGVGSAWGAFSATTSNGTNSFSAASDSTPPTVSRSIVAKTSGATPGTIRQGGDYYVYAQVTDAGSGVSTARTNTSSFDTGVTAASLSSTGGPWTIGGLSYNYRSALLTANTPLNTGSSYSYTITATDVATNSTSPSYSATIETYNSVIAATSGILSHWRLGDGAISADELDDTAGVTLQNHSGALDASWTRHSSSSLGNDLIFTNANRVRKSSSGNAIYYTSATPSSANYSVEADLYYASAITSQNGGVIGRVSTSANTYYVARYDQSVGAWNLAKFVNGTVTTLGTNFVQTLTPGTTYQVTLNMNGTSISLSVDGVQRIFAFDSSISATGKGGLRHAVGATPSNTTGIHLDNFQISSLTTTAVDGPGTNNGTYTGGVRLNQPAGLVGDTDRSATFDGVDDYVNVTRQIQDNFSIELWFQSTQGLGANAHWWGNAGLVDAEVSGPANDFGVSLRSDGRITAGTGTPDASILSSSAGYANGAWHHVVFTRTRFSGALNLYVDGASAGSATGSTASLTAPTAINFGRILTGVNYFTGSIDEVAVYSSALSSSTVSDHYKAGKGTG